MKRKAWNKRIAWIISFVMCLSLWNGFMPQIVNAAERVSFTADVSSKNLQRGDLVTYSVKMNQNESGTGLDLVFNYDDSVLELQETVEGDVFDGFSDLNDATSGTIHAVIASNNILQNGIVFTATFKVKDTAKGVVDAQIESVQLVNDNYDDVDNTIVNNTAEVQIVIPVEGIYLNKNILSLEKGASSQLSASISPEDANTEILWSSSDTSVATVDENGNVMAVGKGVVTVTAKADMYTANCEVTVTIPLESIEIIGAVDIIKKGQTTQLEVVFNPTDTTDNKDITWSSSDTSIATVSANGTVTALKDGVVTITATVGTKTDTYDITVQEIKLTAISMQETMTVHKGETDSLTVTYIPSNTTDEKNVTFLSSDSSVVTVDTDGKVTAKKAGTATITLTGSNNISAVIEVTVKEISIDEIVLDKESTIVEAGETASLQATIKPENNTDDDQTITWSSSDKTVAIVEVDANDSSKVTVKAIAGGTAVITAKAWNGTQATCTIKVPKHIESIVLPKTTEILRGDTKVLEVIVNPTDVEDDTTVIWSSSNPEIASVDKVTGMITAIKEGTVEIIARTNVVDKKTGEPFIATTTVVVKEQHLTTEMGKDISFDEVPALLKGQKFDLNKALNLNDILEQNAVTDDIYIEWKTSDEAIATVEQSGIVYGVKEGTVTITAVIKAMDGAKNTKIYELATTLEVKEIPLEEIAFDKIITEMQVGATDKLNIIYNPENTTDDKTVIWTSSDDAIISVYDGVITAKKAGKATITAEVGKKKVSCEITVKETEVVTPNNPNEGNSNENIPSEDVPVKTGDSANIMFYVLLLLCGLKIIILTGKQGYLKK